MELHNLAKITTKEKRRLGQGHGSGRVKTSGRGTKGKNARGKVALSFEGGALPLIKRLPFHRGKGKNRSLQAKPLVLNVSLLNTLPKGTVVDVQALIKYHIIDEQDIQNTPVKLLGNGELTVPLTVKLPASKQAIAKIEQAGGTVESAS